MIQLQQQKKPIVFKLIQQHLYFNYKRNKDKLTSIEYVIFEFIKYDCCKQLFGGSILLC